jgi:UDP-N-acetyl-D-glucosamine/UDP-N-acetyl-D-galactosamine dehydrogenase
MAVSQELLDILVCPKCKGKIHLTDWDKINNVDAVVIATPHKTYREMPLEAFTEKLTANGSLIDVKSILDPDKAAACGHSF